ncbi:MAG: helix-turn-helix transcriptional regulator [Clostridia bacterium]|nr:helix-turn-helix transcriptional regulator [Clostridia bacterium]
MVDFGCRLKKLRKDKGYTQVQLASRLGVTKSVVSYYELQERYPSPEVLIRLASIFHVSTDYLLGLNPKETIDLEGLSEEDVITVKRMIEALRNKE